MDTWHRVAALLMALLAGQPVGGVPSRTQPERMPGSARPLRPQRGVAPEVLDAQQSLAAHRWPKAGCRPEVRAARCLAAVADLHAELALLLTLLSEQKLLASGVGVRLAL